MKLFKNYGSSACTFLSNICLWYELSFEGDITRFTRHQSKLLFVVIRVHIGKNVGTY